MPLPPALCSQGILALERVLSETRLLWSSGVHISGIWLCTGITVLKLTQVLYSTVQYNKASFKVEEIVHYLPSKYLSILS